MSFLSYLRVETGRIFRSRIFWLVAILTLCAPIAGYLFYFPATLNHESSIGLWIANPALAGTFGGTVLFALLTLYELDRVYRKEMASLTDTIVSPLMLSSSRTLSLLLAAAAAVVCAAVLYLPYTLYRTGALWDGGYYLFAYLGLMLPTVWSGILLAAALYQFTRRVELSAVLLTALVLLSMSQYVSDQFLLRWINPLVPWCSDYFGNLRVIQTGLYSRLLWLLLSASLWLLSLPAIRKYGYGLGRSFLKGCRKVYLPFTALVLIGCGFGMYLCQPFINHSQMEYASFSSHPMSTEPKLTIDEVEITCKPNVMTGTQQGTATYKIFNLEKEDVVETFIMNCGYTIDKVTANGETIPYTDLNNDLNFEKQIEVTIPPGYVTLVMEYSGMPQVWNGLRGSLTGTVFSPEFISLEMCDVYPYRSFIEDGKLELTLPEKLIPISNWVDIEVNLISENTDGTRTWELEPPRGGYFGNLYAAEYIALETETENISAVFYCPKKQQAAMEEVNIQQILADVLEYCSAHYGTPPFAEEGKLRLIEAGIPATTGGYAVDQTSIMSENTFYEKIYTASAETANSPEIMIHEIVHQWWGLGKNLYDDNTASNGWSSEGLTTYTTYRIIKEKYGEEYAREHCVDVWQSQADYLKNNFYFRHPEYLDRLPEQYAARVRGSVDSIMMYSVVPLKILKAEKLVGGEEKMDEILKGLFTNQNLNPITYADFLDACGLTEEALELD